jgi:predicted MFS family arabinose efflux permease
MNKNDRLLLFALAAVQFTHIMDFMIMMPLGPQLMRIFEINPQQFGFLVSAYTISAGIVGFFGAFFIDRFDRKKALLFVYSGFIIGTFACGVSPSYHFLLSARILTGAFGGVSGALILSIIGDTIPLERRASAMGVVMAAFSVASVFGVPFGLFMANEFSWHAPFLFIGIVGAVVVGLITIALPSLNKHLQSKQDRLAPVEILSDIFKDRNQKQALLLMVFLMFGQFSIIPFISPYMVANVGFSEHDLTYIYLFGGLLTIFTSPMVGKAADKYGKHRIFTIFVLISLIPIIGITNMPIAPVALVLVITTLFFICAGGRMIPAMALITSTVPPKSRGSFMSINSSVQQLSSGLAAFIAGAIVTKDSSTGQLQNYSIVGAIAVCASLLCIFLAKKVQAKN